MRVLALDLGTTMGYALGEISSGIECIETGYKNLASKSRKREELYNNFSNFLEIDIFGSPLYSLFPPISTIIYEKVLGHTGTAAAHVYGGLEAIMLQKAFLRGIKHMGVPPTVLKKHITGKGNASKEEMIQSMRDKGYTYISDHNEADALALLHYYLDQRHTAAAAISDQARGE